MKSEPSNGGVYIGGSPYHCLQKWGNVTIFSSDEKIIRFYPVFNLHGQGFATYLTL